MTVEFTEALAALSAGSPQVDARMASVVFGSIDQSLSEEAAKARVRVELWDHECSLNGVEADVIKERSDYIGGEVYLIYVDGALTVLQPTMPGVEGLVPMTVDEAKTEAHKHAAEMKHQLVVRDVVERMRETVVNAGVTNG